MHFTLLIFPSAITAIHALPFAVKLGSQGTQTDRALLQKAIDEANTRLETLDSVLQGPHANTIIQKAFGSQADVQKIHSCVQKLVTGKVFIPAADVDMEAGNGAATDPQSKHITFSLGYFSGTTKEDSDRCAGTLIHEASHALCGTYDNLIIPTVNRLLSKQTILMGMLIVPTLKPS
ncbi:hypothetical protein C8J55DRAFT_565727 [Lentinula edodes]|uniref:Lysine-specific metallo-endopeptidase domain-containing protein n=1 Tax=Lentinula lateritia TaxID=40482 RepID=A0A9W8ZTF8_9AGAR|nr:hypothetical protein C8J55DRAFT_565727 [Lentinula edodes]